MFKCISFGLLLSVATCSNAYLINGDKWGDAGFGTGATISWSLMDTGIDCAGTYEDPGCTVSALTDFMPVGFKNELTRAFDMWSTYADLTFVEVADSGDAMNAPETSGDIRIGGHYFDGANGVLAHGYYPSSGTSSVSGDVHFDKDETWSIGFGLPGFDVFQVFIHELGHALGLGHSVVPQSLMNATYVESFSGPQADDIAGIQYLYGPAAINNQVPEPASVLLLTLGLLGLMTFKKWQRAPCA